MVGARQATMQTPRLLEPTSLTDAELAEVYALRREARLAASQDESTYTVDELVRRARRRPAHYWITEWVVEGGYAQLCRVGERADCQVELAVAPTVRRRGLGTRLFEAVAGQARAARCRMLMGEFAEPGGAAFAAGLGARIENSWHNSVLALPVGLAVRPVPGYSVRSWCGAAPENLIESWAAALNSINDAPHAEGIEPRLISARALREKDALRQVPGVESRVTAILDAGGDVVATTELVVYAEPGSIARTESLSVLAAHRRKGLATWLKAESLAALMADRPDVALVRTSNDVTNTGMLAVNRMVGFTPVATWTNAVIDL
jgi:mycothiol synthase